MSTYCSELVVYQGLHSSVPACTVCALRLCYLATQLSVSVVLAV